MPGRFVNSARMGCWKVFDNESSFVASERGKCDIAERYFGIMLSRERALSALYPITRRQERDRKGEGGREFSHPDTHIFIGLSP